MPDVEVSQTTSKVTVVELLCGEAPALVTVKKAVNPSGVSRHFTLKTPVPDTGVFQRLVAQVQPGDEIIVTIVNEWHETGRITYLLNFTLAAQAAVAPPALVATV